ncbi:MAG: hypothetical protein JW781_09510, partial [Deltaproteobacteria bacterium]|nr:hypothetical protein [Candidatus Anaeroferrophillacea bacterium]
MKAHLLIALGLALGLACAVFVAAPVPASQAQVTCQRYVAYEGSDTGNDCREEGKPCATVQHAVDQSAEGDRICVASSLGLTEPTVYKELITIDHTVILDGKWESKCTVDGCNFRPVDACDASRVVLDAQGNGRVITIEPKTSPTIDCFTITGGDADKLWGDPGDKPGDPGDDNHAGGGIYGDYASPIIVNNVISGNFGCDACTLAYGRGGGIYLLYAGGGTLISGNLISHNVADNSTWGEGGGIMLRESHGTVEGNLISYNRAGNSAGYGGGIAVVDGRPAITGNAVSHNIAGQAVMGIGGGIWVWSDETVVIDNNSIYSNRAISGEGDPLLISRGGGIYYGGNPTVLAVISGNMIRDNVASLLRPQLGLGGGLYVTGTVTPTVIAGNVVEGNWAGFNGDGNGGGLYVEQSEATIEDNEIAGNYASWAGGWGKGGGLYVDGSAVTIRGNSFVRNAGGGFAGPEAATMGSGGGMVISDTVALVENNAIVSNHATNSPGSIALGGGVYVLTSTVRIVDNTISGNSTDHSSYPGPAGLGGGLYLQDSLLTLDANTITYNEANATIEGRGGGVRLAGCPVFTATNNIIARNSATLLGSGMGVAGGTGRLAHNTIADNTGGDGSGLYVSGNISGPGIVTLYGNIIRGHKWGIATDPASASTVTAYYTLFEDNTTDYGLEVTSVHEIPPPALLRPDYRLSPGSNAIHKVPPLAWVTRDIDGQPRPLGSLSDAGADEYMLTVYLPV